MFDKRVFFKFLFSALASAAIVSIYSIVDAICVGQYSGSVGSAAIAVCMPIWAIVYAFGSLFGIGGATLMTVSRAKNDDKTANSFFTVAFILTTVTAILIGTFFLVFKRNILVFFGASNEEVLETAMDYSFYIGIALTLFVFVNFLMAFVRNDFDPTLTAIATILSGIFNVVGDVFFVFDFGLNMDAKGAGLATAIGQTMTVIILCLHFFKKKNRLKLAKPIDFINTSVALIKIGISAFILDVSTGILITIFNNRLNYWTNSDATTLGIFGIICNMMTLVQGFSYAVGQASQPLFSDAFGHQDQLAIKKIKKYGLSSAATIGIVFLIILMAAPSALIRLFINVESNPEALDIGNAYIRLFFFAVPLLSLNVFFAYYYQSLKLAFKSFIISFSRGIVLPVAFIFILPLIRFDLIFISVSLSDVLVFLVILINSFIHKNKEIKLEKKTV